MHLALDTVSTKDSQTLSVKTFAPGPGKLHLILFPDPEAQKLRDDVKFTCMYIFSPPVKIHLLIYTTSIPPLQRIRR